MARGVVIAIGLAAVAAGGLRFVSTDAAMPTPAVAATRTAGQTEPSALPSTTPAPAATLTPTPVASETAAPAEITVTAPAEHWGPARAGYTVEDRLLDFHDSTPALMPDAFSATIAWGDGSTDVVHGALGTAAMSYGFFPVEGGDWRLSAVHTYVAGGEYAATVVVSDTSGGSATQALRIFVLGS